ncbi:alpha/beta hydrolase [uncultured Nisaea sp.]|uniref:alpha/beta fold hydrolase n=1 Tax=uncultured Nisaea sp. TaxID=538215 RepID=UPI0030EDD7B6|tara:strand:- start:6720 stop:7523 length:804 start_codon:yes stop_codon:yes gene_type:complete
MTWTIPQRSDGPSGLALSRAGSGPTIVLIHGVGLRSESWARQIPALAERCTVIAVDLPGHGDSASFVAQPALADYAGRIADVIDRQAGPAVIAGHSLGALIALEIAIRHPDLCAGVAALNAIFRRSKQASDAVRARADGLPLDKISDPEPTLERWFSIDRNPDAANACRDWLLGADPAGYKAAYTVFAQSDGPADEALRTLSCPALFLTGSEEPNSTPAMSGAMAALVPDGECAVIDGAAHMMPMTHSGAVNRALLDFAARCHGGAA